jgi:hypothetical protein
VPFNYSIFMQLFEFVAFAGGGVDRFGSLAILVHSFDVCQQIDGNKVGWYNAEAHWWSSGSSGHGHLLCVLVRVLRR